MKHGQKRNEDPGQRAWRQWFVLGALALCGVALVARAVYLQVIDQEFLEKQGDARILRVEVTALREDTFYGSIVVEYDGQILHIDSRPSDALALAVRANVPIYVAHDVMETAGITPEADMQDTGEISEQPGEEPATPAEEDPSRLSVFEDFLEKLDLDNLDQEDSENPDKKD